MKQILFVAAFLTSFTLFAQDDDTSGVIVGTNQYYTKANFLSSKSKTGFTAGLFSSFYISDNSQIVADLTVSRFYMDFLGRETLTGNLQWIAFSLDRINLDVVYHYDVVKLLDDDFVIGVTGGASLGILSDFTLKDDSKSDYYLDPYGADPEYMRIDTYNESPSFNVFAIVGATVRYDRYELNLRYNKGITDTYRNLPMSSAYVTPKGKDDYLTLAFHWYTFGF